MTSCLFAPRAPTGLFCCDSAAAVRSKWIIDVCHGAGAGGRPWGDLSRPSLFLLKRMVCVREIETRSEARWDDGSINRGQQQAIESTRIDWPAARFTARSGRAA